MKNIVILLFSVFLLTVLPASGQNYLIGFAGTGAAGSVTSVKVENLTKGTTLTLNGTDFLNLTTATGINSIDYDRSSDIKIYPNPMNNNTILQVYAPVAGNAIISVIDLTGRLQTQIQSKLDKGMQEFHLSGLKSGSYLISVSGNTYRYSGKLLSNNKAGGSICLEKIVNSQAVKEKSNISDSKGVQSTIDMAYSNGDIIRFTGTTGIYSTVKVDVPASNKTITFNFIACTDGDNNNYPIVEIYGQVWMKDNLKTTKYANGDPIGTTLPATLNITAEVNPKYQWSFDGNEANVADYGRLYTWYAVTDSRNVCPTGWHVPLDGELTTLTTNLGGESVAGGKLKETGTSFWQTPNTGATNSSGFSAMPNGYRAPNGDFLYITRNTYTWSATEYLTANGYFRLLFYDNISVFKSYFSKQYGFSVRCLKNP
jgi:uncharacterized protein (TIGR02145 family)